MLEDAKNMEERKLFTPISSKRERKRYSDLDGDALEAQLEADAYYTASKQNVCVACGATEKYLRFHVVPTEYRCHFPEEFKSHCSHDVLLLRSSTGVDDDPVAARQASHIHDLKRRRAS